MPLNIKKTAGTTTYGNPFVGSIDHMLQVVVDISELTDDLVDADGYLKPGAMFKSDGTQPDGSGFIYAINPEPQNIRHATIPPTDASLAADTGTIPLGMAAAGMVNRDIVEDNLGRALTANELAAFTVAGCQFILTNT